MTQPMCTVTAVVGQLIDYDVELMEWVVGF